MALFPRGAEGGYAARWRRRFRGRAARGGLRYLLQVGVRARVLLWGVSFAASESQRPDDVMCCVQRRRSGACFAWGRGFRHCCVAVPKSRGWGADFPWLVHLLWARRGVGGGARTPVLRAGICVCVWALGAPPPRSVAALLRGASEAGRSPPSGCLPPGGCRGPLSTCCGHGCAGTGSSAVPVARIPCVPQGRAAGVSRPACPLSGASEVRHSPSPDCPPSGRAVGVRHPLLLWAPVCRCEGPALSPWLACPVGAARRGGGGGPSPGGWPATVVSSVSCQALSLPRSPTLWACRQGPPPICCGRGCAGLGARHCPLGLHALSELRAAGMGGGRPRGAWPATVVGGVWCQTLSLPQPPALWGSRHMCPRCGRCGRGDPAPAPQRAPLRAGVARRGGGGKASPGGCLLLL